MSRSWSWRILWGSTWGTPQLPRTCCTEGWRLWQLLSLRTKNWIWLDLETGIGRRLSCVKKMPGRFLKGWGTILSQKRQKIAQKEIMKGLSFFCKLHYNYDGNSLAMCKGVVNTAPPNILKVTEEAKEELELQKERRIEGFLRWGRLSDFRNR